MITKPTNETDCTLDKILRVEGRIHALKGDMEGLFENYVSDLILLRELRATLAREMVNDAFPTSPDDKNQTHMGMGNAE